MSKCCVICVGRNADRAADRIEAYAKKADFEIVETIFKDTKSVERLKFYIERDSIISILVSSIYDISSDKDVVKGYHGTCSGARDQHQRREQGL